MIRAGIEKERFDVGMEAIYREIEDIAQGHITQQEYEKAQ